MTSSLTPAVAKELKVSADASFAEAHGRLFARILLALPAGLDMDEAGAVIAECIADVAEANQLTGYYEALALWDKEIEPGSATHAKIASISVRMEAVLIQTEEKLSGLIQALQCSSESMGKINDGIVVFKEASKRKGYAEAAIEYTDKRR